MVQAIINVTDHANRILNIVKAKYGLRTKSEAIEVLVGEYEREILEPELRPEYVEKLRRIEKQKPVKVGSIEDFKKRYKVE